VASISSAIAELGFLIGMEAQRAEIMIKNKVEA
jgi:hypothetical protein